MMLLSLLTASLYLVLAATLAHRLRTGLTLHHRNLLLVLVPALLHAYLLHVQIDTPTGQNLSLMVMASMVSWIMVLLLIVPSEVLAVPLLIFALPLAAVCCIGSALLPASYITSLKGQWLALLHIFTALLAYSLLLVAAVQALMLGYLEQRLRSAPRDLSPFMPPLTLQETFMFRVIGTGFGLLTLSLLVAFIGLRELLHNQPLHRTVFSVLSWVTFATLLSGRVLRGWRGKQAVRWTLIGFAFLALGYAGSRLLIEYLLNRT